MFVPCLHAYRIVALVLRLGSSIAGRTNLAEGRNSTRVSLWQNAFYNLGPLSCRQERACAH